MGRYCLLVVEEIILFINNACGISYIEPAPLPVLFHLEPHPGRVGSGRVDINKGKKLVQLLSSTKCAVFWQF